MSFLSNLHTHTVFSDGADTMENMILRALELGFVSLGFSDHAPSVYEKGIAIPADRAAEYRAEFGRLREKYGDKIELYLGMERDSIAPDFDSEGLNYFIGSVHALFDRFGNPHTIDYKPEMFEEGVRVIGGGDVSAFVGAYFCQLETMLKRYKPLILGHMDIVKKTNDDSLFWDENAPWYEEICAQTVNAIAISGCIVEVNTALMQRPGRNEPYPSPRILSMLRKQNIPVTITSDSHKVETLNFGFDEAAEILRRVGYKSVKLLKGGVFTDWEI